MLDADDLYRLLTVAIPGRLRERKRGVNGWDDLLRALLLEEQAVRKQAREYNLEEGRPLEGDPLVYEFPWEYEVVLPEGTPARLRLASGREVGGCEVLAVVEGRILVSCPEPLGPFVRDARLIPQPEAVLRALRAHLEESAPWWPPPPNWGKALAPYPPVAGYNAQQIRAAFGVRDGRIRAVWGPPGTGKTRTLALAVKLLLEEGRRVLVLAPTNTAVDQAVLALVAALEGEGQQDLLQEVLRYGSPVRDEVRRHPSVSPAAWVERFEPSLVRRVRELEAQVKRARSEGREPDSQALKELAEARKQIREALQRILAEVKPRALFTTVAMAITDDAVLASGPYTAVVVDEASMVGLAYLLALLPPPERLERLALFGDFRQLPPVTASDNPSVRRWLGRTGFDAWCIPAAIRGRADLPGLAVLKVQYRMHPGLRKVVSRLAYEGRLRDDPATAKVRVKEARRGPLAPKPVVWVNTQPLGAEACRPAGGSRWNLASALLALHLAVQEDGLRPIAIITPYAAQARLLFRLTGDLGLRELVPTGTVHRFQGSEAPVVVVDLVEARRKRRKWQPFFQDDAEETATRLLNVALSRAQVRAILLWDWDLWGSLPPDSPLCRIPRPEAPVRLDLPASLAAMGKADGREVIVVHGEDQEIPEALIRSVQGASRRILVYWPEKHLPEPLKRALWQVRRRDDTAFIQVYPPDLPIGVSKVEGLARAGHEVELPSTPVVVVDEHTWWQRTTTGLWIGLLRMNPTVRLLLEFCGWTQAQREREVERGRWPSSLASSRCCGQPMTVEPPPERWSRRPRVRCSGCGKSFEATPQQVQDWLHYMDKFCSHCRGSLKVGRDFWPRCSRCGARESLWALLQ